MPRLTSFSRSVSGLVAIVTGAASGMGRATAFLLADEGAKVAVTDVVDPAPVTDAITKAGGEAIGRVLDVSDGAAIAGVVSGVADYFGGIDILVNNAGIARPTALDAPGWEDAWAETIAVNLTGEARMIRSCLPYLQASACGRVVNIASTEGLVACRCGATGIPRRSRIWSCRSACLRPLTATGLFWWSTAEC
jgi:3-oxoacyl-[acyl-carrier protein] reductase